MRRQCLRLAASARRRPVKLAVPPELPAGLQSAVITRSRRQSPCSRLPRSHLIPRRGKSKTGGKGQDGEKLGTCGGVQGLPARPKSTGGTSGGPPGRAGHPAAPSAPQKGRKGPKYMSLQAMPNVLCTVNICVFVNLAASFVLQVLWLSKLLSGRMKLSGCPAVLVVFREGVPTF